MSVKNKKKRKMSRVWQSSRADRLIYSGVVSFHNFIKLSPKTSAPLIDIINKLHLPYALFYLFKVILTFFTNPTSPFYISF